VARTPLFPQPPHTINVPALKQTHTWQPTDLKYAHGKRTIIIKLNIGWPLQQDFHLANVTSPILGVDFFASNRIAIDMTNKRLISLNDLSVEENGIAAITTSTSPGLVHWTQS